MAIYAASTHNLQTFKNRFIEIREDGFTSDGDRMAIYAGW
jgi:hypothetical protein